MPRVAKVNGRSAVRAQETTGPHFRSVDLGLHTYRGRHELALLLRRMGEAPRCAAMLRQIVAEQPEYLPAQADLVETLQGLGCHAEVQALLTAQELPRP